MPEIPPIDTNAGKPYTVRWRDQEGVQQKMRRVPPRKLHTMLPNDKVELSITRNEDFKEGDKVKIKHISPRHPNTLQVEDGDGNTTFIGYHQVTGHEGVEKVGETVRERLSNLKGTRYLSWP